MANSILPIEGACEVAFEKKEFAIVGDAFFASTLFEVPSWLQEAVTGLTTSLNASTLDTLVQYNLSLLNALTAIDVSKNTYDQYINKVITDNQAFVDTVTTLNSTIAGNDASIRNLLLTYATNTEVTASIANAISASLSGGSIGAALSTIDSTIATQYGALTQRFTTLESTFVDNATQQAANATATQVLETYTGWGLVNSIPQVIANSKFYQDLTAYLSGTNYDISGSSTLLNFVQATATSIEAKFAYNSVLNINGTYYNSGFGLSSSATSGAGTKQNPYNSEFWIDASRLKFTNSNQTGQVAPFTIDASGVTPKITFNGIVDFNNTNANGTTTINGSKITTGSITAEHINTAGLRADQITSGYIDATRINAGTITANMISSGELDINGSSSLFGYITTIGAFNSGVLTSDSLVGTFSITNTFSRDVRVVVFGSGRTGVTGIPDTSSARATNFAIFANDSTTVFEYGWTPMYQDSKSIGFSYNIPANSTVNFYVRGRKTDNYDLSMVLKPVWTGVRN